jgi:hypothetical protein
MFSLSSLSARLHVQLSAISYSALCSRVFFCPINLEEMGEFARIKKMSVTPLYPTRFCHKIYGVIILTNPCIWLHPAVIPAHFEGGVSRNRCARGETLPQIKVNPVVLR